MSFLLKKHSWYVKIMVGDDMNKDVNGVPLKNYIFVLILSIFTIVVVSYFIFWYKNNTSNYKNNSVISGYLSEIGEDEIIENLSNYVLDNPDCVLYVSFGNQSSLSGFESDFKTLINEYNIKSSFIYADFNLINDKKFVEKLQEYFFSEELKNKNISLIKQPNLLLFKDGKIIDVLYSSKQSINLNDVKSFLFKYEVIAND